MNVLEKILEEIEKEQNSYEADHAWNYSKGLEYAKEIIRSHMDEAKNDDWISVDERLPEEDIYVMCCFDDGEVDVLWQNWQESKFLLFYSDIEGKVRKVVAWQPLPKQYKPKKTIPVAGMDHIMNRFTKVK